MIEAFPGPRLHMHSLRCGADIGAKEMRSLYTTSWSPWDWPGSHWMRAIMKAVKSTRSRGQGGLSAGAFSRCHDNSLCLDLGILCRASACRGGETCHSPAVQMCACGTAMCVGRIPWVQYVQHGYRAHRSRCVWQRSGVLTLMWQVTGVVREQPMDGPVVWAGRSTGVHNYTEVHITAFIETVQIGDWGCPAVPSDPISEQLAERPTRPPPDRRRIGPRADCPVCSLSLFACLASSCPTRSVLTR